MVALPPVALVLRLQYKHTVSGDTDVLVHQYYAYTGTIANDAAMNSFCTSVATAWNTNIAPLCGTQVSLTETIAVDLNSATGPAGSAVVSHAGTRTGGLNPNNVCANIGQSIARRYRGGRPKQFWPMGTDTDVNTGQTWTTGFVSAVNSGYAALVTAVTSATLTGATITGPVNVSYFQGFKVVTSPTTGRARNVPLVRATPVQDVILSSGCASRIASQRRRLGKTP